jgi:hypothetical protein
MVWEPRPFWVEGGVLEGNVLRLICYAFIGDWVSVLERFYVMNLLNLGLYEKLIFLLVHYFIDYIRATKLILTHK